MQKSGVAFWSCLFGYFAGQGAHYMLYDAPRIEQDKLRELQLTQNINKKVIEHKITKEEAQDLLRGAYDLKEVTDQKTGQRIIEAHVR